MLVSVPLGACKDYVPAGKQMYVSYMMNSVLFHLFLTFYYFFNSLSPWVDLYLLLVLFGQIGLPYNFTLVGPAIP